MGKPGPTPSVTVGEALETFTSRDRPSDPLTATEVAEELGCTRRTAHRKLEDLVGRDDLETKKVGARSRVWWRPADAASGPAAGPGGTGDAQLGEFISEVKDYAIFTLEPDGTVASWNEGAVRIKGYEADEVVGEPLSTFYTDEAVEAGVPARNLEAAAEAGRHEDEGWRVRKDGSEFWASVTITAIRGEDDSLLGFTKVTRDLTERKRAEEEHRLNGSVSAAIARAESLEDGLDDAVEAVCRLTDWEYGEVWLRSEGGFERTSTSGSASGAFGAFADRAEAVSLESGGGLPARVGRSSDSEWVSDLSTVGDDVFAGADPGADDWPGAALGVPVVSDGEVAAVLLLAMAEPRDHDDWLAETVESVAIDLGGLVSRKRAEDALERERAFLDRILEASPVGITVFSDDGEVVRSNPRAAETIGVAGARFYEYSAEGRTVFDGASEPVPPAERPYARAFETGEAVYDWEGQVERPDGERRWVSVSAEPIRNEGGAIEWVVTTVEDVTERRERERQLRRERNVTERILEAVPLSLMVVNRDGEVERLNERARDRLGPEESEGYVIGDRAVFDSSGNPVPPGERPYVEVFETGEPLHGWEGQIDLPRGRHWVSVTAVPLGEADPPERVVLAANDVTRLKEQARRLERRRDELESELSEVYERVDDAFYALDADWRFTYVNERAEAILDRTEAELIGESIWEAFPEAAEGIVRERYREAMETQEPVDFERYSDSLDLWVRIHAYPSETGLSVYFRDVTDRRRREEQLRSLNESARAFLRAGSAEEIAETVVAAASEVLDIPGVGVYHYDGEADELYPAAGSSDVGFIRTELPRLPVDDSSLTGHVFASGESRRFDDVMAEPQTRVDPEETEMRSGVFAPLGEFGILIGGEDEVGAVDDETRRLVELLAANAEAAYERVERKRALEASERRYRALAEHFPNGAVALFDGDLRFELVEGSIFDTIDYAPEDIENRTLEDLSGFGMGEGLTPHYRATLAGEETTFEIELSGSTLEVRNVPVRDEDGEVVYGLMMVQDVTDRVERERELEQYRHIVESVNDGVYTVDRTGTITRVNATYAEMVGRARDELVGTDAADLVDDDVAERARSMEAELVAGERETATLEAELDTASGERVVAEATFSLLPGEDDSYERIAVVRDVTERKQREQELEEYERIVETVDDGVYVLDESGRFGRVNDAFASMTRFDRSELLDEHARTVFGAEFDEYDREARRKFEAGDIEVAVFDEDLYTADGEAITVENRFQQFEVEGGRGRVGVVRDVTERKEREAELQRALDLLERTEDVADVGGWELDTATGEVFWTDNIFDLLEYPADEEPPVDEALDVYHPEDRHVVEEAIETAVDARDPFDVEARYFTESGEERWFRILGVPETDGDEVVALRGAVQDVTERIRRRRELRESEERLRLALDAADMGAWELDLRTGASPARSPRHDRIFGYEEPVDDWGFGRFLEHVHPDDRERIARSVEAAVEAGEWSFECRIVRADGAQRWIAAYGEFHADEDGEPVRAVGVVHDVTERKERERALERYETVFETVEDGIYVLGPDLHFREVNDAYVEMTGYDRDELVGAPCSLVEGEETSSAVADLVRGMANGDVDSATLEADVVTEDGSRVPSESKFTPLPADDGFRGSVGVVRDLTDRKEYERELRRYETLIEESTDVNAVLDLDGSFQYVTPSAEFVLGYEPSEMVGEDAFEYIHPEDRATARTEFSALVEDQEGRPTTEFRFRHADGFWVWLEARGRNLLDDPTIDGVVVYTREITDRKRYELELEDRTRQQEVISELGRLALETPDLDELFADAARLVAETLDTDYCEVLDLDPDTGELLLRRGVGWREGTVGRTSVPADVDSRAGYTLLAGEPVVVEDLAAETRFSGAERLTSHDVTSGVSTVIGPPDSPWGVLGTHDTRRRTFSEEDVNFVRTVSNVLAEAIRRQSYQDELEELVDRLEESNQRLEQFAYVASHDLQEPLRMVSSYLKLVEDRYADSLDEDAEEFIGYAVDGAERMGEMIDDLLAYSRVDTEAEPLEPTDAEEVLDRTLSNLRVQIRETDASVDVEPLPTVLADENQLEQVFQNLVSNAIKYSGAGAPEVDIGVERHGDEWAFSVADDGIGIAPKHTDRIFDVFDRLHSHEEYPGTGIGLALCQKIVERHGGEIWVDSEPEEGSTFYFTVPVVDRGSAASG